MNWAARMLEADRVWRMTRHLAEQHECDECGAAAGEHCTNILTGGPLDKQPAHWRRIKASEDP